MRDAEPGLGKERRREGVVIVQAAAVCSLVSVALKAAAPAGAAEKRTKGRRLEGQNALPTVAAAKMIFLAEVVIQLDVVTVRRLAEGQVSYVVIGRRSEVGLVLVWLRQQLQDGE